MTKYKIVLLVLITLTLWFNRYIFFEAYDQKYLTDYYSFSQWALPLSSRILPDGKLYQHAGYRLINKFEPFSLNPEAPPLGKVLIGLSIYVLQNAYITMVLMWLVLLATLAKISHKFFSFDSKSITILLSLAATSPLLVEQFTHTLLDLPQITFMVLHILCLFYTSRTTGKKKLVVLLALSGIFLGAVAATKIALYIPFILIADLWYLYAHSILKYSIVVLIAMILSYAGAYSPYIISHGLTPWIDAQKWMINFYKNSQVEGTIGMIFITSFTGLYSGWWGAGWQKIQQWTPLWMIGIISLCSAAIRSSTSKQTYEFKYFAFTGSAILFTLTVVPFWPRYLVFLLPFFWITCIHWLKSTKYLPLLYLVVLFQLLSFIQPNLDKTVADFNFHIELGAFEEQYEYFSTPKKVSLSRDEYVQSQLQLLNENKTYEILTETSENKSSIQILHKGILKDTLYTYSIHWVREHNQWKVGSFELQSLQSKISSAVVPYSDAYCILPTHTQDWSKTYTITAELTNSTPEQLNKQVMKLVPQNYCMPINLKPKIDIDSQQLKENGIFKLETKSTN